VARFKPPFPGAPVDWEDFGVGRRPPQFDLYAPQLPSLTTTSSCQRRGRAVVLAASAEPEWPLRIIDGVSGPALPRMWIAEGWWTAPARWPTQRHKPPASWMIDSRRLLAEGSARIQANAAPLARSAAEAGTRLRAGPSGRMDAGGGASRCHPTVLIRAPHGGEPSITVVVDGEVPPRWSGRFILPLSNPPNLAEARPGDLRPGRRARPRCGHRQPSIGARWGERSPRIRSVKTAFLFPGLGFAEGGGTPAR